MIRNAGITTYQDLNLPGLSDKQVQIQSQKVKDHRKSFPLLRQ